MCNAVRYSPWRDVGTTSESQVGALSFQDSGFFSPSVENPVNDEPRQPRLKGRKWCCSIWEARCAGSSPSVIFGF
jgi:hypothetical protein